MGEKPQETDFAKETLHEAIRELAKKAFDQHGVMLCRVDIDWWATIDGRHSIEKVYIGTETTK